MHGLPPDARKLLGKPFKLNADDDEGIGCLQLVQRFVPNFNPVYTPPDTLEDAQEMIRAFWREGKVVEDPTSPIVLLRMRSEAEPSHVGVILGDKGGVLHSYCMSGVVYHCWGRLKRIFPDQWRIRLVEA